MKFEEALRLKNSVNPEAHFDYGKVPIILVVPKKQKDFDAYKLDFYIDPKSDERAKLFDNHDSFQVFKFYIMDVNVFFGQKVTNP